MDSESGGQPGVLQSMGLQRVADSDLTTKIKTQTYNVQLQHSEMKRKRTGDICLNYYHYLIILNQEHKCEGKTYHTLLIEKKSRATFLMYKLALYKALKTFT